MYRAMLLDHLEKARTQCAGGAQVIAHQRKLVAELAKVGHTTHDAQDLLKQFKSLQRMHLAHVRRLERELAENAD